jgi:hypothetical protein
VPLPSLFYSLLFLIVKRIVWTEVNNINSLLWTCWYRVLSFA